MAGYISFNGTYAPFARSDQKANWFKIGCALDPAYWGEGVNTEAVRALTHYLHQDLAADYDVAYVIPSNLASQGTLLKTGFENAGSDRSGQDSSLIFIRTLR